MTSKLPPSCWDGRCLEWGDRTHIMAIVNVTPDSFSGDGRLDDIDAAVDYALMAEAAGATIIDVGGESTRPGHKPISSREERGRVVPTIARIATQVAIPISIDTSKAEVAAAALDAGASMINDVRGFTRDARLARLVAERGVPAVVMHDVAPDPNEDLLLSIRRELERRLDVAVSAGISWEHLIVDPGFGFGKDWRMNLELLRRLPELREIGRPILVGLSRKSTIGRVLGAAESERREGTMATTVLAIAGGADIVRVHDVRENALVARMTDAVVREAPSEALAWNADPPG